MTQYIRPVRAEDAGRIAEIYRVYVENTAISFEAEAPDAIEMRRRIADYTAVYPWLVYERDGKVLGYAYSHRYHERAAFDWVCECSVYVDEQYRGQGIGKALYRALFAILALMGIKAVYAAIEGGNSVSIAMHMAMGFRQFAVFADTGYKLGAWHDIVWLELELGQRETAPQPIVPAAKLDKTQVYIASGVQP